MRLRDAFYLPTVVTLIVNSSIGLDLFSDFLAACGLKLSVLSLILNHEFFI